MSSTGQATSSTQADNVQLIIDALADYTKETGIDLSKNPFAAKFEQSNSPEAILQLLQEREKAFKQYRNDNRGLINCLNPAVKILHRFSGILGQAVGQIPFPPATILFAGIDTLLGAAIEVSSSYDALLDLFEYLGSFVKRLDIYTKIDLTPMMTDIILKIMVQLLSVVSLATKQISQKRFKKFAKKLLGETEIEAVLQRLDRLTQEEARITVAQTLGVVHGLVGNVRIIMEDREASMNGIRQDLGVLRQVLMEINGMKRDKLQTNIQNWLSPPNPSANHNSASEARYSGTGAWFFESESLKEWNARGSLLWIHGKPGAGKSTLLSAIIDDIQGKHAIGLADIAYYYFDFRDSKKQDCYGLLSSLVLQLSVQSDFCSKILSKLYSDLGPVLTPTVNALKICIKDMLSQPGQGPIYIIVDGLDECPNPPGTRSARGKVLELIKELVDLQLPNVHLCVASRPEIDIRKALESSDALQLSLHDEPGQEADIVTYITSIVNSNNVPDWTEEDENLVVKTLSRKANGMFRWVACQMDNVLDCYSNDIQEVLDDLPADLDETYERTLRDISNQKRKYAQRLFQCLLVSIRPLRVEELAAILPGQFDATAPTSFQKDSRTLDAKGLVLSACASLITIINQGGSQVVQFAHFSVKEYLISERLAAAEERLSYYHILPEPAHTILAHSCLSVLLHLDDEIDRDTIAQFPFAPYAAQYWVDHAQFGNVSSHIEGVMERLFDPAKPHFVAWVWLYDIDRHWTEHMPTMHPTQPEAVPVYYASLCGFVGVTEHLIAAHSRDVNCKGGSHTTALHAASVKGHLKVASLLLRNGADPDSRDDLGRVPLHRLSQRGQLVMEKSSLEIAQLLVNSGANVNVTDDGGFAPLHAAAQSGYREIAELLLGSNASLDARNEEQETPLKLSCSNGKLDMARFLIDRGSDINSRDELGFTPLHAASRWRHVEVARLLLDRGSDVNAPEKQSWTALHQASRYGYLDLARLLIDRGADVNAQQEHLLTPLHFASRSGYLDLARLLIDRGADVNAQEEDHWTPLHQASRYGYLDLVRLLIDRGANVNAQKEDRRTPLHQASSDGHLDIAKLLIDHGANVDSRSDNQETPLALASGFGYPDVARFLIEKGAAVSAPDKEGNTPFHWAAHQGRLDVTKFLLECGIDVDIRNEYGQTSLYQASMSGKLDIVRFLIDKGANIHIEDDTNSNALHIASFNGCLDVVQLLINTGTPVDTLNGTQNTPLTLASREGEVEVVRFLIHRGADLNVRDDQSQAPLHLASQHGHLDMTRLLLDHGVDPNIKRDDLWTSLHLASANGHFKIAELLVQRGASVDVPNDQRETPLYLAITNGNAAIARLLIDHGASVHIADSNGWTVLHAASRRGHLGIVKLLLRQGADVDYLNNAGRSASELASDNGQAEVAKFISEYKANPNTGSKLRSQTLDTAEYDADEDGKDEAKDSLHAAAEEGNIDTVKSLLERGMNINARNASNETPLHRAAGEGNVNVVRLLIERGAEVDSRNKWAWTPLHKSSRYGHLEVSQVLLDHGAKVNARMGDYWTPMHLSAGNGYLEIVKLLLERGADIHVINREGQTPCQRSLASGYGEIADLLREHSAGRSSP